MDPRLAPLEPRRPQRDTIPLRTEPSPERFAAKLRPINLPDPGTAMKTETPFAGVFTSWKTTAAAILAAIVWLLRSLGIVEISPDVESAILTVLVFLVGLFARDANKSSEGTTVAPETETDYR